MGRKRGRKISSCGLTATLAAISVQEPTINARLIWQVKEAYFPSWVALAHAMGYDSDSSVTGPLAHPELITEKFCTRFLVLLRRLKKEGGDLLVIHCAHALPSEVLITAKARHCRCGIDFIPHTANQKKHARNCTVRRKSRKQ